MKSPGIHARIVVTALVLICGSTILLGMLGIRFSMEFVEKRFHEHLELMGKYLAVNAEVGILVNDRAWLKKLARSLLEGENDIVSIRIINDQEETLIEMSTDRPGPYGELWTPVVSQKPIDVNELFSSSAMTFLTEQASSINPVGKVGIRYSTHDLNLLKTTITRRFIMFFSTLAGLAGVIYYFISRSIVDEIKKLATVAHNVAEGDFKLRAVPGSLPEARKLATVFNTMLDSIEESNAALAHANKEVAQQRSLAEMGQFSLMIAHEFKNPLGIIKGSLDILKKEPAEPTRSTMIEYIDDEVKQLNILIENFLTFALPIRPFFREVDAGRLLESIIARLELTLDTEIVIRTDIPEKTCVIEADPDLLTKAFNNIIRNGCDAMSGHDGRMTVTASCLDDVWQVCIGDQGGGIAPENLEKIFEPFFSTRSKGCGLGLAFASQVVKAHSGEILVENRLKGGAWFTVRLPVVMN